LSINPLSHEVASYVLICRYETVHSFTHRRPTDSNVVCQCQHHQTDNSLVSEVRWNVCVTDVRCHVLPIWISHCVVRRVYMQVFMKGLIRVLTLHRRGCVYI